MNLWRLKQEGHRLMKRYVSMETKPWKKKHAMKKAYQLLCEKTPRSYACHFSQMKTEEEVLVAIQLLEEMIENRERKYIKEIEELEYKKILPREELRKALEQINETKE